jgi:hypothetical protein
VSYSRPALFHLSCAALHLAAGASFAFLGLQGAAGDDFSAWAPWTLFAACLSLAHSWRAWRLVRQEVAQ